MDTIIAISIVTQAITAIIIAIITYKYTHFTKLILESNIDPEIYVTLQGNYEKNVLFVENDSGCNIKDFFVDISVGIKSGISPSSIRKGIFQKKIPNGIKAGCTETVAEFPLRHDKIIEEQEPIIGVEINPFDLIVEYSFIRVADRRRFCYSYKVGILNNPDGTWYFDPSEEPKRLRNLKKQILKTIEIPQRG